MTPLEVVLGYLLIGFVLSWSGAMSGKSAESWRWELAAALLWPLVFLVVLFVFPWTKKRRRRYDEFNRRYGGLSK